MEVEVNHIELFQKSSTRNKNDETNKKREKCLELCNTPEHPFFKDAVYGPKWVNLGNGLIKFINATLEKRSLATTYTRFSLQRLGGRSNHIDFLITLHYESSFETINFEFKFNSVPQFANIYEKDRYIETTLAEWWYDKGWLDEMCKPYKEIVSSDSLIYSKPPRDQYLKEVNKGVGTKSPPSFFKDWWELDHSKDSAIDKANTERKKIVHSGIKSYLTEYGTSFDIEKFSSYLNETQKAKVYGIWKPTQQEFAILEYSEEEMSPTDILSVTKNSIILQAGPSKMKLLLRWKNTIGVTLPCWQASIQRPKAIPSSRKPAKPNSSSPK